MDDYILCIYDDYVCKVKVEATITDSEVYTE